MFLRRNKFKFIVNKHHKEITDVLDKVLDGELIRVIINIAPRYSKTEIAVKNFIGNGFALNPACKFIHLSYSDDLANDNSEEIRDTVKSEYYQQLFPYVQISQTTDAKKKWNTTEGGGLYAVSTGGQVTGFGAGSIDADDNDTISELLKEVEELDQYISPNKFSGAIVIDDPLKPEDALSSIKRDRVNLRFETTIRSRTNSRKTPIIIIMQRLHEDDLCGYLIKKDGIYSEDNPSGWYVLSLPCIQEIGGKEQALWPHKHTLEELYKIRDANQFVFDTQYMQNPMPIHGLMYDKGFRTYANLPSYHGGAIKAYTDTADTGEDYLCTIIYVETEFFNYVLDVYYTQEAMETTEQEVAMLMNKYNVKESIIESNNGGRSFSRAVERICREQGNFKTHFRWFHQTENKYSRIFTRSAEVQNTILFPEGWISLFSKFYNDIITYTKVGKNAHDDAPDALTGTVEKRGESMSSTDLNSLRRSLL